MKPKFQQLENAKICHFSHILDHRMEFWKYASFEGPEIAQTASVYRVFSIKKALLKSAKIENSRMGKTDFLVQNVKNQFLHSVHAARVRPQAAEGPYFKDGSTQAGARASKPPAYPTHPMTKVSAKL